MNINNWYIYIGLLLILIAGILNCAINKQKCLKKFINSFNVCDENINFEIERRIFNFIQNNKNLVNLTLLIIGLPFFLITIFSFTMPHTWDNLFGIIIILVGYIGLFSLITYLLITLPIYTCMHTNNKSYINLKNLNYNPTSRNINFIDIGDQLIYFFYLFISTFLLIFTFSKQLILSLIISFLIIKGYIFLLKTILKNQILRLFFFVVIIFLFIFFSFPNFILKRYHITNYSATLKIIYTNPICYKKKIIKNYKNKYCEINATIYWDNGSQIIFLDKKNKHIHKLNNSEILDTILYNETIDLKTIKK